MESKSIGIILSILVLISCNRTDTGGFNNRPEVEFELSPVKIENYPVELNAIVDSVLLMKGVKNNDDIEVFFRPIIKNFGKENQIEKIDSNTYSIFVTDVENTWHMLIDKRYFVISCSRIQ